MPGPHYALSEALIVLVSLWIAYRFVRYRAFYGAAGVGVIGAIAAVGMVRYGLNLVDPLSGAHRFASQVGGALAMALIALQFVTMLAVWPRAALPWLGAGLAAFTALGVFVFAQLATPLSGLWLLVLLGAVVARPHQSLGQRMIAAMIVLGFLANALWVRQSPALGPSLSWHLFHIFTAFWLAGIYWVWRGCSTAVSDQFEPA